MSKLYDGIDRVWQWIAEKVFVRFEFQMPADELRELARSGRLSFALTNGGVLEWLILSSWCRSQGLGAILVCNRKRVLILSKPKYFFQILFRSRTYGDLFLSEEQGPRLLFVSGRDRKGPFASTPSERTLCEVYSAKASSSVPLALVPIFILWRKHVRGDIRKLSEYFFGLSSSPNLIGKLWYLARRRLDSTVKALEPFLLGNKEKENEIGLDGFGETEAMRVSKQARRRILINVNQEMRVVLGPRYHSPYSVKETLLRDPDIVKLIEELAKEEGVDRRKVMSRSYQMLTEIVSNYRFRFIEVMYVVLTWLFSKVFDGLVANESEWQRVREVMKTKPVVFVPCHRSHLDYLVIPYLLFLHDMVTPHIAAGINLAFWPAGPLLRRGGAFFIRRSFRGDRLYSALLKKYVEYLLHNRYNIKFFIEGTRSRSGKMLAPAYGILKMTLGAYQNKVCDDIAYIPVSICYDEVPEQGSYTKELGGGQKVQESAVELLKSRNVIKRRFGKVYVRLAPAISARDFFSNAETSSIDSTLMLQKAAFQISKSINDVTPITPKSLVSTILLAHRSASVPLEDTLRLSRSLADYVGFAGYALSVPEDDAFRRAVEQTVRRLQKGNIVSTSESVPRSYFVDNKKRVVLNFYKNNAIHCFVAPAIVLLAFFDALKRHGKTDSTETLRQRFLDNTLRLRNLLKFEFFFNPTPAFLDEVNRISPWFFGEMDWKDRSVDSIVKSLETRFADWNDVSIYLRLLGDLIESYLTFANYVKDASEASWEKKALLGKVMKFAESRVQQGGIAFPESISMLNYSNALLFWENQKLLVVKKEGDKTFIEKVSDEDKLHRLMAQLTSALELMQEKPEALVHSEARLLLPPDL